LFHVLLPDVREHAAVHLALHGGQGPLRPAKVAHGAGPHYPVTPADQPFVEHHLDGACGIVARQRRRLSCGARQGRDLVVGQRAGVHRLQAEVVHAASMDIDGTPSHASPTAKSKAAARIGTGTRIVALFIMLSFVVFFFSGKEIDVHVTMKERMAFCRTPSIYVK
jgi:hypothetical protein